MADIPLKPFSFNTPKPAPWKPTYPVRSKSRRGRPRLFDDAKHSYHRVFKMKSSKYNTWNDLSDDREYYTSLHITVSSFPDGMDYESHAAMLRERRDRFRRFVNREGEELGYPTPPESEWEAYRLSYARVDSGECEWWELWPEYNGRPIVVGYTPKGYWLDRVSR